ncbi:MAG: ABC transporter permease [Bacteroidales bacterium]|nr:ABC transporter permease [Bacteroidales bacterium]MDZ4205543.1 ABC transporter permease [Bacteroidales bacterium]
MLIFIAKRLFYGIFVLFGVITIVFFLFNILPGDPTRMMLGQRTDIASVEAIQQDLGLNRPVRVQYFNFLNDLSPISWYNRTEREGYWYLDSTKYAPFLLLVKTGENGTLILKKPYLRRSYQSKRKVTEIISTAFPNTAILATASILFAMVVGIGIGIFSALHKDTVFDRITLVVSVLGMSVPSFFAAILFAWLFAFVLGDYTGLNMFGSLYTVDDLGRGEYLDLKNLVLPAFTLGIRPLAVISELTRNSLLEVLSQDYIRTAYAKGLSRFHVITRHALKNAMNPIVTAISGWFASLMAGAVFVEYVFDWKGLGVVIVDALEQYDFPVIMGAVLFISVILIIINIFTDIIYGWLDPRVRAT